MNAIKFKSPDFSSFYESTGRVLKDDKSYVMVAVETGFLAGKVAYVEKDHIIGQAQSLLTDEQRNQAIRWYNQNCELRTIAQHFSLSIEQLTGAIRTI